jgi:putative membrane protein
MWITSLLLFLLISARPVLAYSGPAHPGQPLAPHDLWAAWTLEPGVLLGLALSGLIYLRGVRSLWSHAGVGRGLTRRQTAAFAGGWLALFIALVSPLDSLSAGLFSAHMLQHSLLTLAAAPLIVLGTPPAVLAWGIPHRLRLKIAAQVAPLLRRIQGHNPPKRGRQNGSQPGQSQAGNFARVSPLKWLQSPLLAWSLHAFALWIWHAPGFFQAALDSELIHALEHLSFFGTALLFWGVLLRPSAEREIGLGVRLFALFTMALQGGLLGALLTFAPQPWYPGQSGAAASWVLTPLEDQQFAGALMWVPSGTIYLVAVLLLLGARLLAMEEADRAAGFMREE